MGLEGTSKLKGGSVEEMGARVPGEMEGRGQSKEPQQLALVLGPSPPSSSRLLPGLVPPPPYLPSGHVASAQAQAPSFRMPEAPSSRLSCPSAHPSRGSSKTRPLT